MSTSIDPDCTGAPGACCTSRDAHRCPFRTADLARLVATAALSRVRFAPGIGERMRKLPAVVDVASALVANTMLDAIDRDFHCSLTPANTLVCRLSAAFLNAAFGNTSNVAGYTIGVVEIALELLQPPA
jgi:hypothetical protein